MLFRSSAFAFASEPVTVFVGVFFRHFDCGTLSPTSLFPLLVVVVVVVVQVDDGRVQCEWKVEAIKEEELVVSVRRR